jgi:predicted RNase H-like nuclease (RuvC/YqgF family)
MSRFRLDEHIFDPDYVVREAIDDILSKVETREKLIDSARELAEKRKDESHVSVVRNFETLMVDFLHFYQPLIERIKRYEGTLHDSITDLKSHLASTKSMLQVTKGIEGVTAKSDDLDREITHLEKTIQSKSTTVDRIRKLFEKTKPYQSEASATESSADRAAPHHRK